MNTGIKTMLAAAVTAAGLGLGAQQASALPLAGLDPALVTGAETGLHVDHVRWVCGPYRCVWRPNVYRVVPRPYYWGPRWHRPVRFGWHRHWHHGWHHHW
jgi:hypothetical protein